ncbi:unnamed protein product, partial [Porites evermanni]
MSSLILPRVSRQTCRLRQKAAASDDQMSGLSDIFSNPRGRLVQEFGHILSSQPIAHQRLKATRGHRNVVIEKLQAQDVEDLIHRPVMCSQQYHENQPLEFYCEECKVPICHKCSVVSHNRHTITDTQKAAQVQKMQMMDALEKVKAETVVYEKKVRQQTELMDKNKKEIMLCEKKMTDLVDELIRDLREHERVMKTKFAEIYEAQQKNHATQLENFELVLTQLKSCVERGESIVQRNISAE